MSKLILKYLRSFPVDFGKHNFVNLVKVPEGIVDIVNMYGVKFRLDPSDHVMRQIFLRGVYEKNTIRHVLKNLKKTDTFVDVGTNIGAYTLNISKHLTAGKVISFEPSPKALSFLEENIELNSFTNITVVKKGLSNKKETATLYFPSLTTASINKFQDSDQKSEIELTTLDDYCEENGVENIDILKIDIEGHEFKCLEGARRIIEKSKTMMLIMEIDDNCVNVGMEKKELFDYVVAMGFRAFLPKGYPLGMKEIEMIDPTHKDNIIFIKK